MLIKSIEEKPREHALLFMKRNTNIQQGEKTYAE